MVLNDAQLAAAERSAAAGRYMALLDELGIRTWLLAWGGTAQAHGDAPIYKYGLNASERFALLNPLQQDALLEMVRRVYALRSTELFTQLVGRVQRMLQPAYNEPSEARPWPLVQDLGGGRIGIMPDRYYLPIVVVTLSEGKPVNCERQGRITADQVEPEHGEELCWHKLLIELWLLGDYGPRPA